MTGELRILSAAPRAAVVAVLTCVLAVTAWIACLDLAVGRGHLGASYIAAFTEGPLWLTMTRFMLRATFEEVVFRLGLMTFLVWLARRVMPRARIAGAVAAIILAQVANVWPQLLAMPIYGSLRYLAVGCVWGCLYWRHGWVSGLAGHVGTHLLLDPLLLLALRA